MPDKRHEFRREAIHIERNNQIGGHRADGRMMKELGCNKCLNMPILSIE